MSARAPNGLTLWVGGSSSLTHTYVNQFGSDKLLLLGLESLPPVWVSRTHAQYVCLDLKELTAEKATALFEKYPTIVSIVVGVRPSLVSMYLQESETNAMAQGIGYLLSCACQKLQNLQFVLHISSVAAADHLRGQTFASEEADIPPLGHLKASYDVFKRKCELVVSEVSEKHQTNFTNLRLSAIFSDDTRCIQCNALSLQARIGCFLPLPIDCNSAANVARAINAILCRAEGSNRSSIKVVYNYTRPKALETPVPYGYYLKEYRAAYHLQHASIWIPVWIVIWLVASFHWIAQWNTYWRLPYIDSLDYLLQVSSREHSFNCTRFQKDFPEVREETILECFVRRNVYLQSLKSNK